MDAKVAIDVEDSPYLRGNFAPIRSEDDFVDLPVRGELPAGLAGVLYRNGPNPQFAPRDGGYHWFVGDGMMHAFHVEDGRVRYRNRYARTPKWTAEHAAGRALFGSWGDPRSSDPSVIGLDGGVANTNVLWHGGRLLALEEAHAPFEMDPDSLESRGYRDAFGGRVTAHPKIDPETGEMVFFAYAVGEVPLSSTISYGVADAAGRLVRRQDFEAPYCSMIHDFMVTRDHVLFPVLPLTGSLERAMRGGPPFAWEPGKGAFVGVMRRDADVSTIRWFETEACYVFHVLNAWDDGDRIVADVMQYDRAPLFPNADGGAGAPSWARLTRWTFDLSGASNVIRSEPLDDLAGEFPRIDERRAGLANRHGWFAAQRRRPGDVRADALVHIDFATGRRSIAGFDGGDCVSEPVFAPRSADAAEGDGWITAVVWRAAENRSDFVVYEAQDISAGPVAVVELPRRTPFGFHGDWRPSA